MKTKSDHKALLEIGSEEIPARFVPDALAQLSRLVSQGLKNAGVPFSQIHVWGTPRRLSILIDDLAARSSDRVDMAIGPPPKAAKDEQGVWTQAAVGFAKAQKTTVDKLVLQNTPKGERYVALRHVKGQKTEAILKDLFPSAIQGLSFPKSMIWDSKDFRFARPIRWIVALFKTSVIRFRIAGVASDRATFGLLSLGGLKVTISKPERYKTVLQGRCILVDPEERKKNIRSQMETISKRTKSTVIVSEDHLEEVVYLTEYPVSILGHFPEAYLSLPREILISVLKKHQKFFPMESAKGQLSNSFVGVRNGPSDSQEDVCEGYERVLNARFSDAQFFYEKDSHLSLENLAQQLTGVGFHPKLGSLWDKTVRVRKLTAEIGSLLGLENVSLQDADRVALLSKADLLTQMVGEFPELQGIAGRFYGEKQEKKEVAQAIEQHYWPLTSESALPPSPLAALVAVADKMDTLAANFSVGLIPSGSADPYGLRRMAVGVVRILLDQKWTVPLDRLIETAFAALPGSVEPKACAELKEFFNQRITSWFGNQGYRVDEIEAVIFSAGQSLSVLSAKLQGLKAVRERPEFDSLAQAIKRTRNLLTQAHEKGLMPGLGPLSSDELSGPSEKSLLDALIATQPRLALALENKNFEQALLELAPLKEPVDAFFQGVMVMVDDEKVRSQRLQLLRLVKDLFDPVADFSKLQAAALSRVS